MGSHDLYLPHEYFWDSGSFWRAGTGIIFAPTRRNDLSYPSLLYGSNSSGYHILFMWRFCIW